MAAEEMKAGQIVFNLLDYREGKTYISTSKGNKKTTVKTDSPNLNANGGVKINIYENLVDKGEIEEIKKLGIQAPPGTKFTINNDKNLIMGRTGVYELDEQFPVTQLSFERPIRYVLNEEETKTALEQGKNLLKTAKENFEQKVAAIEAPYGSEEYWKQYNTYYASYLNDYQQAYSLFLRGINGVYKRPNPDDENDDLNYQDLENVIIDYLYK